MNCVIASALILLCGHNVGAKTESDYTIVRGNLLAEESELQVGGNVRLTDEEIKANDILMRYKNEEVDESFLNPGKFNFSRHYFTYKNDIINSKVYQMIRRMPKGAALHVHSSLMLSTDRLLELTYMDHLYACIADSDLNLYFSDHVPQRPCKFRWQLLSELRNNSENVQEFDDNLKRHFTMCSDDEKEYMGDVNYVWKRFNKVAEVIRELIAYRPAREKFFYEALREFYQDNIMYIEVRSGLKILYELNGTQHDQTYLPRLYNKVAKQFKADHPDFMGIKFIVTKYRGTGIEKIINSINLARRIKEEVPEVFAGFDLVGQEDLGKPLLDFLPILSEAKKDMNFYFHGGETNWFGTVSDENLVDAILLGSKRIGHGYALIKHPSLMAAVRNRDIAIEVNVVSNVVLSLVCDVRNHPLATYLALGMPIVISSDDPGAWGADPLSTDYYIAFVGIASKKADLRMLKQLVINSIRYSALDNKDKLDMFRQLYRNWNVFVKDIIRLYG
ncbi:adenosine deaminase 2-like [Pararge aegeria]|uniref:adenosine deaminase 2-like n=1 Tax=Pararge aegeria TaxID=116150 RepID=UPI0019D1E0AA|nr:adenosine deaminase 2-like [Pararge aegeria]